MYTSSGRNMLASLMYFSLTIYSKILCLPLHSAAKGGIGGPKMSTLNKNLCKKIKIHYYTSKILLSRRKLAMNFSSFTLHITFANVTNVNNVNFLKLWTTKNKK